LAVAPLGAEIISEGAPKKATVFLSTRHPAKPWRCRRLLAWVGDAFTGDYGDWRGAASRSLLKAHQRSSQSTTSRNNDVYRRVPANHSVCSGFRGVSDTAL